MVDGYGNPVHDQSRYAAIANISAAKFTLTYLLTSP